jgi:hypothetical protein
MEQKPRFCASDLSDQTSSWKKNQLSVCKHPELVLLIFSKQSNHDMT